MLFALVTPIQTSAGFEPPFDLASYYPILLYLAVCILIPVGAIVGSHLIGPKRRTAVKLMPYESGVDPIGAAQHKFDVKFYMIAILFLVFDVELLQQRSDLAQVTATDGRALMRQFGRFVTEVSPLGSSVYLLIRDAAASGDADMAALRRALKPLADLIDDQGAPAGIARVGLDGCGHRENVHRVIRLVAGVFLPAHRHGRGHALRRPSLHAHRRTDGRLSAGGPASRVSPRRRRR